MQFTADKLQHLFTTLAPAIAFLYMAIQKNSKIKDEELKRIFEDRRSRIGFLLIAILLFGWGFAIMFDKM